MVTEGQQQLQQRGAEGSRTELSSNTAQAALTISSTAALLMHGPSCSNNSNSKNSAKQLVRKSSASDSASGSRSYHLSHIFNPTAATSAAALASSTNSSSQTTAATHSSTSYVFPNYYKGTFLKI